MLIRIRGGESGIREYLEHGQKAGREEDREQLDERVILAGNLNCLEAIIDSMTTTGQKYSHITLSFREESIPHETLAAITTDFRQFAFSAYDSDEYHFYAEAHLPRIKNRLDQHSGETIERKPHIHIVIPKYNLVSETYLNPFGLVPHNMAYIDAFQESVNATYGLASPKDHPRTELTGPADVLSRTKGDVFQGANRALKTTLLQAMEDRQITDYAQFKTLLREYGEVKVRHAGKLNEYLNVKLPGAQRGVNLKETPFTQRWIERPAAEREALSAPKAKAYSEPGPPRSLDPKHTAALDLWHSMRAREVKHLRGGQKKQYAAYRAADPAEQRATLDALEQQFVAKYRQDPMVALDEVRDTPTMPLAQLSAENAKHQAQNQANRDPEITEIKQHLDARQLLAATSHSHGVDPDKYKITQGRDGGDRIRCGSRNLNVTDFLTQELHLSWADAKPILQATYAAQRAAEPVPIRRAPRQTLWTDYRTQWQPQRRADKEAAWAAQKTSEQARRREPRDAFTEKRRQIESTLSISNADRRAALSVARMEKAVAEKALREQITAERQALKARFQKPRDEQYRDFLTEKAHAGDETALLELRRRTPHRPTLPGPVVQPDTGWEEQQSPLLHQIRYQVGRWGQVDYQDKQGQPLMTDAGRKVHTHQGDQHTLELALRLSVQKFGQKLQLEGDETFKHAAVDTAVDRGLWVDFCDLELNQRAEQRRQTQQKGRAAARDYQQPAGELVAHGTAPYQFDKNATDSYYVTFKTVAGDERTVWGVDLERSLREARAEIGDRVRLTRGDREMVTVTDKQGHKTSAERVTWHAEHLDPEKVKTRERHAELTRSYERLRERERGDFSR